MEFCKVQREGHCLGKHELLSHNEIKEDKKDNSNDGFATFADFDHVTFPSDVVPENGPAHQNVSQQQEMYYWSIKSKYSPVDAFRIHLSSKSTQPAIGHRAMLSHQNGVTGEMELYA